jgi:hypothetical protein
MCLFIHYYMPYVRLIIREWVLSPGWLGALLYCLRNRALHEWLYLGRSRGKAIESWSEITLRIIIIISMQVLHWILVCWKAEVQIRKERPLVCLVVHSTVFPPLLLSIGRSAHRRPLRTATPETAVRQPRFWNNPDFIKFLDTLYLLLCFVDRSKSITAFLIRWQQLLGVRVL